MPVAVYLEDRFSNHRPQEEFDSRMVWLERLLSIYNPAMQVSSSHRTMDETFLLVERVHSSGVLVDQRLSLSIIEVDREAIVVVPAIGVALSLIHI